MSVAHAESPVVPCGEHRTYLAFSTNHLSNANVDISPNGERLAFDVLGDIYTVPVQGGRATVLASGPDWDARPVWSPDGSKIAFIGDSSGRDQIHVVDSASGRQLLATHVGRNLGDPHEATIGAAEWMPDSTAVIADGHLVGITEPGDAENRGAQPFRRGTYHWNGDALYHFDPVQGSTDGLSQLYGIWRLKSEGQGWEKVGISPSIAASTAEAAQISRDGRWLVYRNRSPVSHSLVPGYRPEDGETHVDTIRVRDLTTGEDRVLVAPGMSSGWLSNGAGKPFAYINRYVISPDSRYLFAAYGKAIHRIDLLTGEDNVLPVSVDVEQCMSPVVSNKFRLGRGELSVKSLRGATIRPDGAQLSFSALRRLYVLDTPGGEPRLLAPDEAGQFQPAYSPDGKYIAFVTWSEVDGGHVWRARVQGGAPERLTDSPGYYQTPTWSPDGKRIAFVGSDDIVTRRDGSTTDVHEGFLHFLSLADRTLTRVNVLAWAGHPLVFDEDGERIHFALYQGRKDARHRLRSIRVDGTGLRDEGIDGWLENRGDVVALPSPDGRLVALIKHGNLHLAKCESSIAKERFEAGSCSTMAITRNGARDPRWSSDGKQLEWSFANSHYRAGVEQLVAYVERGQEESTYTDYARIDIDLVVPRGFASRAIVLKGARVITMRGDEVLEDGAVVVLDGVIDWVGSASELRVPAGSAVIDLLGKTLMPGFVDAHAHLRMPRDLIPANDWEALVHPAFGITAAKNPWAASEDDHAYAELIESGLMVGPRLFAAEALVNGAHRIESLEGALDWARREQRLGATFVKYHTGWTRQQRSWIIEAARMIGLNVAAHPPVSNYISVRRLNLSTVIDGVTTSEHSIAPERDSFDDVTRFLAGSGTIVNFASLAGSGLYPARYWEAVSNDPRIGRFYAGNVPRKRQIESARIDSGGLPALENGAGRGASLLHEVAKAGGAVSIGSHGDHDGIGFHLEMWAHVRGGMKPHEVLRAATINGARAIGVADDLGSLEVGKIADIIVLDKDPRVDIRNTLSVRQVMQAGVLRDAMTLDQIWPTRCSLPAWKH